MVNHNNHSGYKKVTSCCLKSRLKLVLEVAEDKKKKDSKNTAKNPAEKSGTNTQANGYISNDLDKRMRSELKNGMFLKLL